MRSQKSKCKKLLPEDRITDSDRIIICHILRIESKPGVEKKKAKSFTKRDTDEEEIKVQRKRGPYKKTLERRKKDKENVTVTSDSEEEDEESLQEFNMSQLVSDKKED